jgi:transposase
MPVAQKLPGKKVLIGDNLSSHLSLRVIDACRENDIEYVCLPPNSTDKMQPLDVGFFAQMKKAWRKQLTYYKERDPNALLLRKTEFPKMLKELLLSLNPREHLPTAVR